MDGAGLRMDGIRSMRLRRMIHWISVRCRKKDLPAMVGQEMPLIGIERQRTGRSFRVKTHALQGNKIRDWRDDHFPSVVEADETAAKEVIGTWGQQEPVRAFETFLVRAFPSRLRFGDQM